MPVTQSTPCIHPRRRRACPMAPRKKAPENSESQEGDSRCFWTPADEMELIAYIKDNHAKGSDGLSCDKQFWSQAAAHIAPTTTCGAVKTGDACLSKWAHISLCSMYYIVDRVSHYSGIAWSQERGADIMAKSEGIWADIVKNISGANHYKSKGWAPYDAMAELVPSKASGQSAFHALLPSSAVSMPSIASSSTASPTSSFRNLTMQDQEHILEDLEKSDSDRSIVMMPPPAPPFDAAQQALFAPSTPGTSISTISQFKPQSKFAGKCKSKGNDSVRSLTHPAGSTKEASVSGKTAKSSCVSIPKAF
ncbi:hypothetical protein BDR07DRAFT_1480772 [Suillus spraguei]|nr:hypothetical protein BDR07DRAFT_1480772 [Suillus spraguei]